MLQVGEGHDAGRGVFRPQRDPLPEDVHADDLLGALGRDHDLSFLREALAALNVELVLVAQAAEQPPAGAGDLRRVEAEALVLGDLEPDGAQLREPGAAQLAPAAPDPVEPLGLVADPDLAQFDARAERRREVAHQVAEVHAPLGGEVDREPVAVPLPLRVAHLHLEAVGRDLLAHLAADVVLGAPQILGDLRVGGGGASHHPALRLGGRGGRTRRLRRGRLGGGAGFGGFGGFAFGVLAAPSRRVHPRHAALALEMRHGPRGRDATPVEPAVGLDDHRLVGGEGLRLAPAEEGFAVPLEQDFDQLAAHV